MIEAIILLIDMGAMLYLCWRLFLGRNNREIDFGYLRYEKTDTPD